MFIFYGLVFGLQMLLKVKDAEIHQLGDEIKMLKDQLQGTIEVSDSSSHRLNIT